jgi:putative colanic acid biosynthesis acetyltransferase WcaF
VLLLNVVGAEPPTARHVVMGARRGSRGRVALTEVCVPESMERPRVIDLSAAPGAGESWDAPRWKVYAWGLVELLLVRSSWQISSRVRRAALRAFGAQIGEGVLLRPGMRVRFPWKLTIGDHSWIGEDVWLHNQDHVTIGADAVVSQGTFVTTGSHALRRDMALLTRPVVIGDGAWVTARCTVLGGSRIGVAAVVTPGTVVSGDVPDGMVYGQATGMVLGPRYPEPAG